MGLQRLGDADVAALVPIVLAWADDDDPLVQRQLQQRFATAPADGILDSCGSRSRSVAGRQRISPTGSRRVGTLPCGRCGKDYQAGASPSPPILHRDYWRSKPRPV